MFGVMIWGIANAVITGIWLNVSLQHTEELTVDYAVCHGALSGVLVGSILSHALYTGLIL